MCDINDRRKSRRKQCTPSRHSNIGTGAVPSIADSSSDTITESGTISNGTTKKQQERKSGQEDSDSAGLLEREQYLQQSGTETIQRLSPSAASSTSSLSTSVDSNSLSFDAYRKEMFTDQCINPMHALYLPVAFHNHSVNSIQVLGYPQMLIPVAVHPHAQNFLKQCLLIDEFMSRNITVPNQICFGETRCLLNVTTMQQQPYSQNHPSTSNTVFQNSNNKKRKGVVSNGTRKRRKSSSDLKPLDLTVRIKQLQQNAHSSSSNCDSTEEDNSTGEKLVSSESDKKYRCDCGVSFSSEVTLNGHKKYYCHNNASQAAPFREPQRKMAYHCQQCDFLPVSASQLAQHIRVNHAAIQAYVCQICGYKGYSQRGIRSHLRTHTEYADEKPEDLINSHVHFITAETKSAQCSNCYKNK
uniref:C2H2-type domain-containing protein n=1 Tax=Elaeophora elaphi TaxID=1147741 RepID=A0A0R3RWX7_9BILA